MTNKGTSNGKSNGKNKDEIQGFFASLRMTTVVRWREASITVGGSL
jgi:hypothetical protein